MKLLLGHSLGPIGLRGREIPEGARSSSSIRTCPKGEQQTPSYLAINPNEALGSRP